MPSWKLKWWTRKPSLPIPPVPPPQKVVVWTQTSETALQKLYKGQQRVAPIEALMEDRTPARVRQAVADYSLYRTILEQEDVVPEDRS